MEETIDQIKQEKPEPQDRTILLGFTCAIAWVWSAIFFFFMWYLLSNLLERFAVKDLFEYGGQYEMSFMIEVSTMLGALISAVATFGLFYQKKWGFFVFVLGQLVFMSYQVYAFLISPYHDDREVFIIFLWTVIPIILLILQFVNYLKMKTRLSQF